MGQPRGLLGTLAILIVAMGLNLAAPPKGLAAQFQEGELIQGPDGSLHIFERGELHAIQPAPASKEQIRGARRGAPVPGGVSIIWPGAMDPTRTLIDQRTTHCAAGGEVRAVLDMQVRRTDWTRSIGPREAPADFSWALVVYSVRNTATPPINLSNTVNLRARVAGLELHDERGRRWDPVTGGREVDFLIEDAGRVYGVDPEPVLNPQAEARWFQLYQVASDAESLQLVSTRPTC